jgi:hypothetical protein
LPGRISGSVAYAIVPLLLAFLAAGVAYGISISRVWASPGVPILAVNSRSWFHRAMIGTSSAIITDNPMLLPVISKGREAACPSGIRVPSAAH